MSFEFLIAAREVTSLKPTQKYVYLTLASHAGVSGLCWPRVDTLVRETGLKIRTVQRALTNLKKAGLVKFQERSGRSTLYWITPRGNESAESSDTHTPVTSDAPPPSLVTPLPPSLATPIELQSELPSELPIKSDQTKARVKQAAPTAKSSPIVLVDDIPQDLLADWQAVRASKNQKVLTATAIQALRDEAAKAGLSAAEAVRQCVISNWARFQASWLTPRQTETTAAPATPAAPVRPPEPEVIAVPPSPEILARIAAIKATPVEPKDPKTNARATIARKTAGEHVSRASLEFACFVLGVKSWKDAAQCAV
ncbi:MAG: helix-turn-helix domain-containing protein [Burkholderiaceae bacterium]|nr:helix-turn-helix domain-containing protein [Burkholderiaceae bacterium]